MFANLKPVHLRHGDVQQDEIRLILAGDGKRHAATRKRAHVVPFVPQYFLHQFQVGRLIVHHHDAARAFPIFHARSTAAFELVVRLRALALLPLIFRFQNHGSASSRRCVSASYLYLSASSRNAQAHRPFCPSTRWMSASSESFSPFRTAWSNSASNSAGTS